MANREITLDEALSLIYSQVNALGGEVVPLSQCLNRVLAKPVHAPFDIPLFNKSAMDGYACRYSDADNPLKMIDFVPAGKTTALIVNVGTCVKIMTGAPIPNGADHVVMKEHVAIDGEMVQVTKHSPNHNICFQGEDIKIGELLLPKGTLLKSQHVAMLAGFGLADVEVIKKPVIAVVSTGDELVEPGKALNAGQIYNSNGYQLSAQAMELGLEVMNVGILPDDFETLEHKVDELSHLCQLIILSGGVSVGDLDFIPQVVDKLGFKTKFTILKMKPGKHTLFAKKDGCIILGLPGNPVSGFVQFHLIGRAIIGRMMGCNMELPRHRIVLSHSLVRKKDDRLEFVPALFNEGALELLPYHGSANIQAFSRANALLEWPVGISKYESNQMVYARLL